MDYSVENYRKGGRLKINRETLKSLEQSENERAKRIANLAKVLDMNYGHIEKLVNAMNKQLENQDEIQR